MWKPSLALFLCIWCPSAAGGDQPPACALREGPGAEVAQKAQLAVYIAFLLPAEVPWMLVAAARDARNGCGLAGALEDGMGDVVGHMERVLPRYPVDPYQCVVSEKLWRGSRVDEEGVRDLKERGVRSIVSLNWERPDDQRQAAARDGLAYLPVPIVDSQAPSDADVLRFLDFVTEKRNQPAYVHCEAGEGRTGVMVAAYRMGVQGWSADCALGEARRLGLTRPAQLCFLEHLGRRFAARDPVLGRYPLRPLGACASE